MRRVGIAVALLGALSPPSAARAEPALDTARTVVDLAGGMTIAGPATAGGDLRPGLALSLRGHLADRFYVAGSAGASLASDASDPESGAVATLLALGGGAGAYGVLGAWTGHAGARAEWVKSLDWPGTASGDPDWLTSGIGAGPCIALARRLGFAWGHPMAIELATSFMVYSLRRPDVYVIQILPPGGERAPAELDGLQVGLFLTGALF